MAEGKGRRQLVALVQPPAEVLEDREALQAWARPIVARARRGRDQVEAERRKGDYGRKD